MDPTKVESKPWLNHYDESVPNTLLPYPERTLLDYVTDVARQQPDHPALLFKGTRITYGELERSSDAFAATLHGLGVRKGHRLTLLLPNCPQFIIAELGAWKAGAIVSPLNPIYTERELETALAKSGAEIVVTLTSFYERVKAVQPRTGLKRVIATNIREYLPPILRILFMLFREKQEGHRIRLRSRDLWFEEILKANMGTSRPDLSVAPDDPAVILLSGGTTGTPKGAVGLHRSYVVAGLQLHAWIKPVLVDWNDTIMLPLPLFHVYGNVGVQSVAFIGRNPLSLIPNPREIKDVLKTIRQVRPAFFASIPTLFIGLLNHPDVKAGKVDFRSIKLCFSGAAPLMAETKRRFEEMTGGQIAEGYSLTEAMMATIVNPVLGTKKIGSIGMPLPDVEVRIVDSESGEKAMAIGEVGEILIRAPQTMNRYWQNPTETAIVLQTHGDGRPWLHTGDLGYVDEDGYLFIVDRKKDLVKTSGYQVWPREIEETISSHPAVAEVGVAGIPDPVKGEVAKVWLVLRTGMSVTKEEIRRYCKERLAPYKVPAHVEFRKDLPKSMVGKVLRRMLAEEGKSK